MKRLQDLLEREEGTPALWLQRAEVEYRLQCYPACLLSLERGVLDKTLGASRSVPEEVHALCLASKVREHRTGEVQQALEQGRLALDRLKTMRDFQGRRAVEAELRKRVERLAAR